MHIHLKRVYQAPERSDGRRVLVERLWPRGISKEDARLDLWLKDAAPSTELRKWFDHQPDRWQDFKARYFAELDARPEVLAPLLETGADAVVTFVFASREEQVNNAVALKEYVEKKLTAPRTG